MKERLVKLTSNEELMSALVDYVAFRENEIKDQLVGATTESLPGLQGRFSEVNAVLKYIEALAEEAKALQPKDDKEPEVVQGY